MIGAKKQDHRNPTGFRESLGIRKRISHEVPVQPSVKMKYDYQRRSVRTQEWGAEVGLQRFSLPLPQQSSLEHHVQHPSHLII